jgi:hypothetical protein
VTSPPTTVTTSAHSIPYQISRAMLAALAAVPELAGVTLRDNPTSVPDLTDGDRILFLEDGPDSPLGQKEGQKEFRSFTLSVGVISRDSQAREKADLDMVVVRRTLNKAWNAFLSAGTQAGILAMGGSLEEGQRSHKIEGIDVGGALIVTAFSFSYREQTQTRVFRA